MFMSIKHLAQQRASMSGFLRQVEETFLCMSILGDEVTPTMYSSLGQRGIYFNVYLSSKLLLRLLVISELLVLREKAQMPTSASITRPCKKYNQLFYQLRAIVTFLSLEEGVSLFSAVDLISSSHTSSVP